MSGDLEQRVARAIATEHFGWAAAGFEREARAAIRIVVEECARKVEGIPALHASIRALLEEGK